MSWFTGGINLIKFMLKRNFFESIFKYSKVVSRIPKHKVESALGELKGKIEELKLDSMHFDAIESEDSRPSIQEVINFVSYKTKFYSMVNKLPDPPLPDNIDSEIKELPGNLSIREISHLIQMKVLDADQQGIAKKVTDTRLDENNELSIETGVYHLKNGKLCRGESESRDFALYSNWNASNVDPDDLNKHKELLDRQHFRGPFWEGKEKPQSISKKLPDIDLERMKENPDAIDLNDKEVQKEKGNQSFEKIKT